MNKNACHVPDYQSRNHRALVYPHVRTPESPVLKPHPGIEWADTMVLNPAIIADPDPNYPERLHMLFRATGPWPCAQQPGKPLPYPIFLGYARSEDNGLTWDADFSHPALAPALATKAEDMYITARGGGAGA
jgi:hypothetical protein